LTAAISLTRKCKTRLKKLATDKRSSLLCCSIGENGKKSYNIVTWNTRDDDNSVGFVDESFVVGVGLGCAATDGGGGHGGAGAGINQSLDLGSILGEKESFERLVQIMKLSKAKIKKQFIH